MRLLNILIILTLSSTLCSCGSKREVLHENLHIEAKHQLSDTFSLQRSVREARVASDKVNCVIDSPVIVINRPDSSTVVVRGKRLSLSRVYDIDCQLNDSLAMSVVKYEEDTSETITKVDKKVVKHGNTLKIFFIVTLILWVISLVKKICRWH